MDTNYGSVIKGNVKRSMRLIESVVDQIDSDAMVDDDFSDRLYSDIQTVLEDLVLIYGFQKLNNDL